MKLTEAQKAAIRTATFNAVAEVLETMDADTTHTNLYDEASTQAKIGAIQALMRFTGDVQTRAAEIGGINRNTLHVWLKKGAAQ